MTVGQATAFLFFAVVGSITPGPSNLLLIFSTGAAVGVLQGLPTLVGQVAGMGFMLFLFAFGFGGLVLSVPLIIPALRWCGIGFLLWLAWRIASAGRVEAAVGRGRVGFWGAAAFQWLNPKSWLICVGAIGAYFRADAGGALEQASALALLFLAAAFPSCFVWLAAGASMQRYLHSERAARRFNLALGALLAASTLLLLR